MNHTTGWLEDGGDATPDMSDLSTAYFALQLAGGHVGLPILVLIFIFSGRVHRPASVINFCLTWILYSVSYSLLMYGGQSRSKSPPFALCLTQAAMIHGAPPMAAVAGLGVVLQAYSTFQLPWQYRWSMPFSRIPHWLLVLLIVAPPYLAFAAFAIPAALIGQKHPSYIKSGSELYCSVTLAAGPFQEFAVPVFCVVLLTIIVTLEVTMIIQYWRGWLRVKQAFPLANRRPSLSPWLRVSVFTLYTLAALAASISFLTHYRSSVLYMIQAALPLVATLIFGSQADIFRMLFAWAHQSAVGQEIEYIPGGGWSASGSSRLSPQLTGHFTLTSEA